MFPKKHGQLSKKNCDDISCGSFRAAIEQQLDDVAMAVFRCEMQRSEAVLGLGVNLGAAIEQQHSAAQTAFASRTHERRVAALAVRLDVSVVVEQQRSNIDVTFNDGTMQCSTAVVDRRVDVGAMRNQSLDFAEFALRCRQNERRKAKLVAFVDIRIASSDSDFL